MLKRVVVGIPIAAFAFFILFTSILRTAAVKYDVPASPYLKEFNEKVIGDAGKIEYTLAYPGKVGPDSPLWSVKALRDRVWLFLTTNPEREAELLLLFADKRLAASKILFNEGKYDLAYSTLTKAEKYLESSSLQAMENNRRGGGSRDFDYTLAVAAMRHYEVISVIVDASAEEMKPEIIRIQDRPIAVYKNARQLLIAAGAKVPDNPFYWD